MTRPPLSIKARALKYLAGREHSRAELARKLAPHDSPGAVERVLDDLERDGWLSTERYVASVARRRGARLGTARVKQELLAKGVPGEAMRDALSQLRATEHERALAVWRGRFGSSAPDADERARQVRFLMARGFEADVARRVVQRDGPASAAADAEG